MVEGNREDWELVEGMATLAMGELSVIARVRGAREERRSLLMVEF